jgi:heat shock protein HtpX
MTMQKMGPEYHVQVRLETSGEATLGAWSSQGGLEMAPLLPQVLRCDEGLKSSERGTSSITCARAVWRDGLMLETVVDVGPIARHLDGASGIKLWVNTPRLGFVSTSGDLTDEEDEYGPRVTRTAEYAAGVVPAPITIRFGYEPGQLSGIYLPMMGVAIALLVISFLLARAGYAPLALSLILLGTMVWMAAGAQLELDAPLRIVMFGSPLASLAAIFLELWPPLICVALGVGLGSRLRGGEHNSSFGEVFGAYAIVPMIVSCVAGALPEINRTNWLGVVCWLAVAPIFVIVRRAWGRIRAKARVLQITTGELKERFSALAARVGTPRVKLFVSSSTRSRAANAFALPGRSVFLTAPLIQSLSKREVDAVMAHELSHARHTNRGAWSALLIAMLFCETPAREIWYILPGGLLTAMIIPVGMYFWAFYWSRRREFGADASAAALTGDPRAMISSLARIGRNNNRPGEMNRFVELFASHPSTRKRIGALAAAWRLDPVEVEALAAHDDPGASYEVPIEVRGPELFSPAWQKTNAGIYGWCVVLSSCAAGLVVAWLLVTFVATEMVGIRIAGLLAGIVVGCLLTKGCCATVMARNYARLGRKLKKRLGVGGQIVGLAPDSVARIYLAYRFSDLGLLRFEAGRLIYQSERITIALNPADVVEVGMVSAAPSSLFRRQPMVRFRDPASGEARGFILHTLDWLATQRKLLRSIEQWRAEQGTAEGTAVRGVGPVASQLYKAPPVLAVARGYLMTGGIALGAAIPIWWVFHVEWQFVLWAGVVTGCGYVAMMLPGMLYRPEGDAMAVSTDQAAS